MDAPSLLVLDQWAAPGVQAGTSKNWLYEGLGRSFHTHVLNADDARFRLKNHLACLFQAAASRPLDLRREFHRRLEWAAKYPAAFVARTERFRRAVEVRETGCDALFQIGGLFGPVFCDSAKSFSYHDQTVAMVERGWPQWLPKNFSRHREAFINLERASLRCKDIVFTYSEAARNSMIEDYSLPPNSVVTAPTACKLTYPTFQEVLGERGPRLLFVSTDFYRKGGDIVFEAFRILRRIIPGVELVIVGGPSPVPLPRGARHLGVLSHCRLRAEYLSSSLLLHPARYDAFPNVLKEAMACGLPAVTSSCAGIPEIIEDGRTGIVLGEVTADSVADAVAGLLSDSDRLRAMRDACLRRREDFRPETCAARIADRMLESLASRSSSEV